jgi:hypothetical protein
MKYSSQLARCRSLIAPAYQWVRRGEQGGLDRRAASWLLPAVLRPLFPKSRPAFALGAGLLLATTGAVAALGTGSDRSVTEAAIQALSAVPAHQKLATEPLARAKSALDRASDARVAGDHAHGSRLEGVAREWAETGRDLVRAAEAEREAQALFAKATALETKAVRGRALLEETMARRERAREKLRELEPAAPGGGAK